MVKDEVANQKPHIAFLSSPGMGHLIPTVELAKRFVDQHGFSATLLTFSNFPSPMLSSFLASLPPSISSLPLPSIPLDDLPPDSDIETRICVLMSRSVPHVRSVLQSLRRSHRLVAFVPDVFCSDTLAVSKELSVPNHVFIASNLALLAFLLHIPTLDRTTTCQYQDLPEPLKLPGCVPLRGKDFVEPLKDRNAEVYRWIVHLTDEFVNAEGFLVNSFRNLEPETAEAFDDGKHGPQPAYVVGPFVRSDVGEEAGRDEFGCLAWLDKQPADSVLFVSFGSGGTLSTEQMNEVAFGLEQSGQRFLWVVRTPNDTDSSGNFFGLGHQASPLSYLPEGFLERTKEVGFVIPSWAPQVEILRHTATGGFLTHCGWNSTLESVSHGVPMIAWPLYAEQRMNAAMLVEGIRIALRLEEREDGAVVERAEIARVVRDLMDGESGNLARRKVRELQKEGSVALAAGGSSYRALEEVANKWKRDAGM